MKKIRNFFKENYLVIGCSFLLPILLLGIAYYNIGIYPGSEKSILATDSFSQYANFHASVKNVLLGKQSIFYTWSGSLGLNYWALAAYYLNGIFTPLVLFFDNSNMPDALYFLTLLKFGASGVAFWFFAHNTFKINRWIIVGLSVSYSLMSFAVGYSEVIMWLDTFIYLPLIVLGINRVFLNKSPILLFSSSLLLFLSSYYMGFMVGVFTFLYAIIRAVCYDNKNKRGFLSYLLTSILAGGASMLTILPAIIDLRTNGESLSSIFYYVITPDTGPWDLIAKNMVGAYDTSKFESMPFVYVGLVPLIFFVYYFFTKKIKWQEKVGYGVLTLLLVSSVYLFPLNLFWHGFHTPNMFLFRFSFLISFLVILLAGYGIEKYTKEESSLLMNLILAICGVFLLYVFFANKKRYDILTIESLVVTISLLFIYLALWLWLGSDKKSSKWVPMILMIFMVFEAGINSKDMILGISNDWGYPNRKLYTENYEEINSLVRVAESREETFFRMENIDANSTNTSFNHGFHGVSMFSSIRNRHSSEYLHALGFRSLGTNLTINYENNTLLADALLGVKYNLAKDDVMKFGYKKVATEKQYTLYENQYALPLGVLTDDKIYGSSAVKNQTELFDHLAGVEDELFSFGEATLINSKNCIITEKDKKLAIAEKEPGLSKELTWLVTIPAKTQGYLSLVPTDFTKSSGVKVDAKIQGVNRRTDLTATGQYYNLGYYEEPTTMEVTVTFSGGNYQQEVEIYRPDAVFLDTVKFAETAGKIQEKGVDFKVEGRHAQATVTSKKNQVLLTTIPYDKGWNVSIDGKKAEITTFKDAFLTISLPEGTHTIEFTFLPQGFAIGLSLFIICIGLFIVYVWWLNRNRIKNNNE